MVGREWSLRRWRPPRWGVIVAVVAALVVALALTFEWNWLKRPIESRVAAATGRSFAIAGDLDVDLGAVIRVEATGITLGNADWSRRKKMASVRSMRMDVNPWPLLRGRLVILRVDLDEPDLYLERNARGDANWRFRPGKRAPEPPQFGELLIRKGVLRLSEPRLRTDLRLDVDTAARGKGDAYAPIVAHGTGRYRNQDFELDARLDSPLQLMARGRPYRVDLKARAGPTRAQVQGSLSAPIDVTTFALHAEVSGENLADLYPLLGLATPETPPYALTGRLRRDHDLIRYEDFTGTVGDSDVSGDASIDVSGERPFARANLLSKRLDLDDLAGLIGAPPSTAPGESASPEQKAEAQRRAASPRVLPDRPYNLQKLRSMDADVRLEAREIDAGKLPVESLKAQVKLKDGVLHVSPLDVGLADGELSGSIRLDARHDPITTATDLEARRIDLPQLFPTINPDSVGRIGGNVQLQGDGNSVAAMLATANGDVGFVMGPGRISNLLLELAGLDIAEALRYLLDKDRTVPVRCAYTDLAVSDGVARTRSLAFDTTDTVIVGKGTMNLRNEELDLELDPKPKDVSPLSLRGPLEIEGTFKDPSFHPKAGPLTARVAAAAALFAIAPPAALLALIETGPGEDVDCGRGTQQAIARNKD